MKKIILVVGILLCMVFAASAMSVVIKLKCGKYVMTDTTCYPTDEDWNELFDVMNEVHCK